VEAAESLLLESLDLIERFITILPTPIYGHLEGVAKRRVPRDERDWPTVALALVLDASIWTADTDFLGCGVPTWTTETLLLPGAERCELARLGA
jgi:predicted nucleic acid-binding protein